MTDNTPLSDPKIADNGSSSHARLMDAIYSKQRHIYDITRRYYLIGRNHMIADMAKGSPASVLEVGCGTGRNLALIGEQCPEAALYGFDISSAMLDQARKNLAKDALARRSTLLQGDATNFDAKAAFRRPEGFDRVFLSFSVSMIPAWEEAIRHSATQLARGGSLYIADFGQMEGWLALPRRAMFKWLEAFHVTPRKTLPDVASALAEEMNASIVTDKFLGNYATVIRIKREGGAEL